MRGALALLALPFVAACGDELNDCPARGVSTSYSGSVAYDGQDNGVAGSITGAIPQTVVVYDATDNCTYDGMQFTIQVGDCLLWVDLTAPSTDGGAGFAGSIETGQTCALPVATGTRMVTITSGELLVDGVTQITIAGSLPLEDGSSFAGGYLWWSFTGQ